MIIKCEYDGKSWSYDDEDLTVLQGIAVEEHIKGNLADFDDGLGAGRTVCIQALGWLVFHGGSPDVPIASVDFPVVRLSARQGCRRGRPATPAPGCRQSLGWLVFHGGSPDVPP